MGAPTLVILLWCALGSKGQLASYNVWDTADFAQVFPDAGVSMTGSGSDADTALNGRVFHATATTGDSFYLYGGFVPGIHLGLHNAMWKFNASSLTWSVWFVTQPQPVMRAMHVMEILQVGDMAIPVIHGGMALVPGFGNVLDDLFYFYGTTSKQPMNEKK